MSGQIRRVEIETKRTFLHPEWGVCTERGSVIVDVPGEVPSVADYIRENCAIPADADVRLIDVTRFPSLIGGWAAA